MNLDAGAHPGPMGNLSPHAPPSGGAPTGGRHPASRLLLRRTSGCSCWRHPPPPSSFLARPASDPACPLVAWVAPELRVGLKVALQGTSICANPRPGHCDQAHHGLLAHGQQSVGYRWIASAGS